MTRDWLAEAVRRIEADYNRSADTHLIQVDLPHHDGIQLYLKDESSHPTGSLKHRLARSPRRALRRATPASTSAWRSPLRRSPRPAFGSR